MSDILVSAVGRYGGICLDPETTAVSRGSKIGGRVIALGFDCTAEIISSRLACKLRESGLGGAEDDLSVRIVAYEVRLDVLSSLLSMSEKH